MLGIFRPPDSDMQYIRDVGNNPLVASLSVRLFCALAWSLGLIRLLSSQPSNTTLTDWLRPDKANLIICALVQTMEVLNYLGAALLLTTKNVEYHEVIKVWAHVMGVAGHTLCSVLIKNEVPLTGPRTLGVYSTMLLIDQVRVRVVAKFCNLLLLASFGIQMVSMCWYGTEHSMTTLGVVMESLLFWFLGVVLPTFVGYTIEYQRRRKLGQTVQIIAAAELQMDIVSTTIILLHVVAGCDAMLALDMTIGATCPATDLQLHSTISTI